MKNIITLPGWGFGASSLKNICPSPICLTVEDLFKEGIFEPLVKIKEAVDSVNQEQCRILAWSLGGLLALDYCHTFSDHKPILILLSPTSNFRFSNEANFDALSQLQADLTEDRTRALNNFYMMLLSNSHSSRADIFNFVKQFQKESQELSTCSLHDALNYLKTRNISEEIKLLKNTCHIIHGEQDGLIPISHSKLIYQNISQSTFRIIPSGSHMLPYSSKTEILEELNSYDIPLS